jgi:prophage tail gpP-like protein
MREPVTLLIGGKAHAEWESYRIDSDLLTPADDWQMNASFDGDTPNGNVVPDFIVEGASIKLMLGDDVILTGLVDAVDHEASKRSHMLELYGRDLGSRLIDCSVPLLSLQLATLDDIITQAVRPLGVKTVEYRAKPAAARKKVHTEPGQTVWEWLQAACEANQVWPWFTPDGTLVIGQPDYTTPPVADLIMRFNGEGNNVKGIRQVKNLHYSYSDITVLGQSAGLDGAVGQHNIVGKASDSSLNLRRPLVVVDGNCESADLATHRAEKIMADSRMHRERLLVRVAGHRITTANEPEIDTGTPWATGMRVHVLSEPHGIDAVYFVIKRIFTLSVQARETELHLIPDGTWLLNLPFVKDKRRSSYGTKKGAFVKGNH